MSGGGGRVISQLQRLRLDLPRLIVVDEDGFVQACSECGDGEHGVRGGRGPGKGDYRGGSCGFVCFFHLLLAVFCTNKPTAISTSSITP